jgi:acyl carrier protein
VGVLSTEWNWSWPLEEAFDVEIPIQDEEKIRSFRTIKEAIDYLRNRKKDGNKN